MASRNVPVMISRTCMNWSTWSRTASLLPVSRCAKEQLPPFNKRACRPFHHLAKAAGHFDYDHEKKTFNLVAPEFYNFSRDIIDYWAEQEKKGVRENNPAFWWIDDAGHELKWDFRDLSRQSKRVANVLTGPCKLRSEDRIIVILPRIPEWWLINIAAIRAAIVLSPGTIMLRPKDIIHRLQSSGAKCIIADLSTVDLVDQVCGDCESLHTKVFVGKKEDTRFGWLYFDDLLSKASDEFECVNTRSSDPMTLFFTSGTTGSPKMTEHSHASYGLGHLITARYFLNISSKDIFWNLSDTGWAKSAWSSLFGPWINGACVFVQHSSKFDPEETIKILQQHPVTHFCTAPTAMRVFVKQMRHNLAFPQLRHCLSAGEPVNPELVDEWKEITGLKLYEGYGQTETTFLCGTYPSIELKPGSMGKSAPGVDLQIVDDRGRVVPRGTEGDIGVRFRPEKPVGLFTQYLDAERRMRNVFQDDFYLTGDRAIMDEDDYVWFVGRSDDVILSSGYRIGPFEVESALLEHPAVLESAVVSSPDPIRGEVVKAFVTLTDNHTGGDTGALTEELQNHVKNITAPYKYPRKIEYVEQLPKTVSGKIRRVELRNKEWGRITEDEPQETPP